MGKKMRLYRVVLDEMDGDELGCRTDPISVVAKDGEEAIAIAKKSRIGVVYKDEIDGEPWESTVTSAVIAGLIDEGEIDFCQHVMLP